MMRVFDMTEETLDQAAFRLARLLPNERLSKDIEDGWVVCEHGVKFNPDMVLDLDAGGSFIHAHHERMKTILGRTKA